MGLSPFMEKMVRGMFADMGMGGESASLDFEHRGQKVSVKPSTQVPEGYKIDGIACHPEDVGVWAALAAEFGLEVIPDSEFKPKTFGFRSCPIESWEKS